jgi:thioredoxin-related protein
MGKIDEDMKVNTQVDGIVNNLNCKLLNRPMVKLILKVKSLIICLLLVLLMSTILNAQDTLKPGINFRPITLEQALVAAKAENKPVFMHCYADWCHFCINMRDSVFTNKEVGDFYNANFINIMMEMEKEGAELNKTLGISTFPSQVFYDTNGEIMHRGVGRRMKQSFIVLGREALDPSRQMRTYKRIVESDTASQNDVYYFFRSFENANSNQQQMVNDYLMKQHDSAFTNAFNWRIVYDFMKDPNYPVMNRVVKNKKSFEKKYTTDSVNNKIITMDVAFLGMYVRRLDGAGYETERQKILTTKGLDIAEKICVLADLNKYKLKSDWAKYKETSKIALNKFAKNDYQTINEITGELLNHPGDSAELKFIESWCLKSVALKDYYQGNFLLAKAYYKSGKKQQATDAVTHAIDIGMKEKGNYKEAILLYDDIQQMP